MKNHLSDTWYFKTGFSPDDFASCPSSVRPFQFQNGEDALDLDRLLPEPGKCQQDGMVYNLFELPEDTASAFGMGCDWWAEVRLNGKLLYSTFPLGNASGSFNSDIHTFIAKGKKGENLLAIHVRRGYSSWAFAFAEKDPLAADPCAPVIIDGDLNHILGPVKPMNAVNNGPIEGGSSQIRSNFKLWQAAKIPFARNHDAAFCPITAASIRWTSMPYFRIFPPIRMIRLPTISL